MEASESEWSNQRQEDSISYQKISTRQNNNRYDAMKGQLLSMSGILPRNVSRYTGIEMS